MMQRRGTAVYLGQAADPTKERHFISSDVRRHSGTAKRHGMRRKLKRFRGTIEQLDELVLDAAREAHDAGATYGFSAEEIAIRLDVKVDQVKHACHRLNLRGILYQPSRYIPHDTSREMWGGYESGWGANRYTFRKLTT